MQEEKIVREKNKGITLIELIVTIAILAIVVLPLLTAFVISMRTNVKAKEKLRAIEIAHNFMEGVEATSVTDIMTQLNYPEDKFDLLVNLKNVSDWRQKDDNTEWGLQSAGSWELVDNGHDDYTYSILVDDVEESVVNKEKNVTASIMKYGPGDYKFLGNAKSKYYFILRGIPSSDNKYKKFDAFVTLDGDTTTSHEVSGNKKEEYNKKPIASIESMDENFDAVNLGNVIGIEKVIRDINTETSFQLTEDDQIHLQRLITLDIERPDPNSKRVKVTLSYSYHCEEFDKTIQVGDEFQTVVIPSFDFPKRVGSAFENDYKIVIYDNLSADDVSKKYLKNIYLFYQPWYTSKVRGAEKDIIRVNNMSNYDCSVKLIKQKYESYNDYELGRNEQDYHMRAELNEAVGAKPAHVRFETNLGTNISDDESFSDSSTQNQATYVYNHSIISGGVAGNLYNAANPSISCTKENAKICVATGFGYSNMSPKGSNYHDRLYDIRVDIYPYGVDTKEIYANNIKPIVSLSGGVTD